MNSKASKLNKNRSVQNPYMEVKNELHDNRKIPEL